MFKIVENPEFTHTVAIHVPVDGGHTRETMEVRFRALATSRTVELLAADTAQAEVEFLNEAVVSVTDLVDGEGNTVPWNAGLRDRVFDLPYVRSALLRAYGAAMAKARAGN